MSRKNLERGRRKARIPNWRLLLPLDLALYRSFEIGRTQIGFPGRKGLALFCRHAERFYRLVYVIGDDLLAAFVRSHVESAFHDADQRSELAAVVLHEKNIFVADLEFHGIDTPSSRRPLLYIAKNPLRRRSNVVLRNERSEFPGGLITNDSGGWARTDARQRNKSQKLSTQKPFLRSAHSLVSIKAPTLEPPAAMVPRKFSANPDL
jgi:hypothetical protein